MTLKPSLVRRGQHRRDFLMRLGAGAAAGMLAPLVPLLNASGQESVFPKRLILWTGSDGIVSNWDALDTPLLSRLNPADIVPVRGINHNYGGGGEGHMQGATAMWTASRVSPGNTFRDPTGPSTGGWGEGPSIDQIVAQGIPSYGETLFQSIALGVGSGEPHTRTRTIYSAPEQPIHPETSALAAFTRLFAGVNPAPTPNATPGTQSDAARLRAESINVLQNQLTRLKPRLALEEQYKLEAHNDGLASILRRLDGPAAALECTLPTAAAFRDTSGAMQTEQVQEAVDLMTDLIVASLTCDVTRIASLQMLHTLYQGTLFGHGQVHNATHGGATGNIDEFYIDAMAKLIEKLKAVPEGNGTMFDNTLIVHGRDLGDGNHGKENIPFILAGGAGGALRTGRMSTSGGEQAAMLVTIGRLMGMSDLNSVGNIALDTGPIDDILA